MLARIITTFLSCAALSLSAPVTAQPKDIKIAHIHSRTGAFEGYGRQSNVGFMLGLEYATGGTMQVNGHKIVVLPKDDQSKPEVGKALLSAAYADDKVDLAVGPTSSSVGIALGAVAQEYKKVLVVDGAVSEAITGELWNRYVFRSGRNSAHDAIGNAAAHDKPNVYIGTLAQDSALGRSGVQAFKNELKQAKVVQEEYLPITASDFTAPAQRLIDKLKDLPGRKIIWIYWAGGGNPYKIAEMDLKRYGIEVASVGNTLALMGPYKRIPGMEGAAYYYFAIPKNPVNEWLVANHYTRYKEPPDFYTVVGFAAANAVVAALKLTGGDTDTEKLIKALEGLTFDTPKGKMTIRKEDHQALMNMYHFKIKDDPAFPWGVPELVREITADEMKIPIRNKR